MSVTLSLAGRRALVSGAGRGLGRGIALALAEAGADLVLLSRTRDELEEVAALARAAGADARVVVCDVTDDASVAAAIEAAPPVEILVNNAGTNIPKPFAEATIADIDTVLGVNVRSVVVLTSAVVRRWLRDGTRGSIVNISSQMGHVGAPRRVLYCTSKHAVEGFTKALAVELAPDGIRVNAVAPTYVETALTAPFLADPAFRADVISRIPLGRVGRVEDITTAVVFLASDAAGLITGSSLLIDGGYTAQ